MAEEINIANYDSIDFVRNAYLKNEMKVTDEELTHLNRLLKLQDKIRELTLNGGTPSVILPDFLYQGDMYHATDENVLINLGIRHLINVSNSRLPKSITEKFHVLWINIVDDFQVNVKGYFQQTNDFLHSCQEKNEKVLVHCQMGISRSSTIILAYLIKYHHSSLMEAYDHLLDRRLFAAPNYGFFIQLIQYEKELRKNF